MGCFLGCFGRRKNRRRQRRRESFQPRSNRISEESGRYDHLKLRLPTIEEVPKVCEDLRVPVVKDVPKHSGHSAKDDHLNLDLRAPTVEQVPKISAIPTSDICDKVEEKASPSPTRKRVTFDSKVKTYEHIAVEESVERFGEKEEEEKSDEKSLKSRQARCLSEGSDITSNSSGSYPSNHRYQNCRESDDEEEDATDCGESDLEDSDDIGGLLHEDYYNDDENYDDSLHNWDKEVYTEEIADNVLDIERIEEKTRGSNASARDRAGYVNAVLNPIENLTQWKAVKSKGRTTQTQTRKENANLMSDLEHNQNASLSLEPPVDEFPSFNFKPKSRDETKKQRAQEIAVDASLSTWLSTSQTTTSECSSVSMGVETAMSEKKKYAANNSKSVQSHDERPILCALSAEEIKQYSATNSPRKSPSRSPESPIIGTVGGYWNSRSMASSRYKEV